MDNAATGHAAATTVPQQQEPPLVLFLSATVLTKPYAQKDRAVCAAVGIGDNPLLLTVLTDAFCANTVHFQVISNLKHSWVFLKRAMMQCSQHPPECCVYCSVVAVFAAMTLECMLGVV